MAFTDVSLDRSGAESGSASAGDGVTGSGPSPARLENGHALTPAPGPRKSRSLRIMTTRAPGFFDITEAVAAEVRAAQVADGFVLIYSRHTTAAIRINENEPMLIADMEDMLKRLAPPEAYYRHNDFTIRTENMTPDESPNGHAHCQHLFLSSSELLPLEDGQLCLGTWQRIFLVELDRPRLREVTIKIVSG